MWSPEWSRAGMGDGPPADINHDRRRFRGAAGARARLQPGSRPATFSASSAAPQAVSARSRSNDSSRLAAFSGSGRASLQRPAAKVTRARIFTFQPVHVCGCV